MATSFFCFHSSSIQFSEFNKLIHKMNQSIHLPLHEMNSWLTDKSLR
jgi:hypothetical protein